MDRIEVPEPSRANRRPRLVGDHVLDTGHVRLLVGGIARGPEQRGVVLEAIRVPGTEPSMLEGLVPVLNDGGPVPLVVDEVVRGQVGERPAIVVKGHARGRSGEVEVRWAITSADVAGVLVLTLQLRATGAQVARLAVGHRIVWGGEPPWAPGYGTLLDDAVREVAWVGTESRGRAVVHAAQRGGVRVQNRMAPHGPEPLVRFTEVTAPAVTLEPAQTQRVRMLLALGDQGFGDAVRRLGWASGQSHPEVAVRVANAPADAAVRVLDASSGRVLIKQPLVDAERATIVPLPESGGRYVAVATRFGQELGERVEFEHRPGQVLRIDIPRLGKLRLRLTDGMRDVPGRLRIVGVRGTPSPVLGPDWVGEGAGDTLLMAGAERVASLAPGQYEVRAGRGPEWSYVRERVHVAGGVSQSLSLRPRRAVDPGSWIAADLHLHADPSPDSEVTLADRVRSLAAEGIALAVATDHNHVTDYADAQEALDTAALEAVPGVEVTTWDPAFGHFNAFPFPLDREAPRGGAPEFMGRRPKELFASLRAVRGDIVIQVNHPRLEGGIGYFDAMQLDTRTGKANAEFSADFDAVEVWNGFDLGRAANVERNLHEWLRMLARGNRVVATGSSDSHKVRLEVAGYPRTYINPDWVEEGEGSRALRALRRGHAFVTSGPFVEARVEGRGPGQTARLRRHTASLEVEVQAPAWVEVSVVEVYVGTERVKRVAVPKPANASGVRYRSSFRIPVRTPGFVVVMVRGERDMDEYLGRQGTFPFAFTNPIWLAREGPPGTPPVRR